MTCTHNSANSYVRSRDGCICPRQLHHVSGQYEPCGSSKLVDLRAKIRTKTTMRAQDAPSALWTVSLDTGTQIRRIGTRTYTKPSMKIASIESFFAKVVCNRRTYFTLAQKQYCAPSECCTIGIGKAITRTSSKKSEMVIPYRKPQDIVQYFAYSVGLQVSKCP